MKIKNKIISVCLCFSLVFSFVPILKAEKTYADSFTVSSFIYSDDFEGYADGTVPNNVEINEGSGSIYVKQVGASKRLMLDNKDDIMSMSISKVFDTITEKTIEIDESFIQIGAKSQGNQIMTLMSEGNEVISIETKEGNIVYKSGESKYIVLLKNYYINKVYHIHAKVDLYSGSCDITINNQVTEKLALCTSGIKSADAFIIKASSSPGFAVDDIMIYTSSEAVKADIQGDSSPVIPDLGSKSYIYKMAVYDINGTQITNIPVKWSLSKEIDGVKLVTDEDPDSVVLTVNNGVSEQMVSLRGMVDENALYADFVINLTPLKASSAKIKGYKTAAQMHNKDGEYTEYYDSFHITYDDSVGADNTYQFSVTIYDQFENEINDYGSFRWSVLSLDGTDLTRFMYVDENSGKITVTNSVADDIYFVLKAVSVRNEAVVAQKTIIISDYETYVSDKNRIETVMSHITNVLDYGKDTYNDSPLISDIISIYSGSMGYLPVARNYDIASCNLYSQSNLMKAMLDLSALSGNSKYEEKVYDIYNYFLRNCVYKSVFASGGHMSFDLKSNAAYDAQGSIHELKAIRPFWKPFLDERVNMDYSADYDANGNEKNGGGYAGYILRGIVAGHCGGDTHNLIFERHYYPGQRIYNMEDVWKNPEMFDSERRGPLYWSHGASFMVVFSEIISLLLDYYDETSDKYALDWAYNCARAMMNSAYQYDVLDENGNPTYDENGNKITWTQGIFNECVTTTKELDSALAASDESRGSAWYNLSEYEDYTDGKYGDRLYNNVIYSYGDDPNWVTQGYCTEEEAELMIEPYQCSREDHVIVAIGEDMCRLYSTLLSAGMEEEAGDLVSDYTKSIYNYLKLRYNFNTHVNDPYMSWIRPSVVRELGLNEYTEVGEFEELNKSWYFSCFNKPSPHRGYYYKKGQQISSRKIDTSYLINLTQIIVMARDYASRTSEINSELSETLYKRSRFMWRVLRDASLYSFNIGDIGENIDDLQPNMDISTDVTDVNIILGAMQLYKSFGCKEYLDFARTLADRYVSSNFNASSGLFMRNRNEYITTASMTILPVLVELQALIEDRESELPVVINRVTREFYDEYLMQEDGRLEAVAGVYDAFSKLAPNLNVPVSEIEVDDEIKLNVGEERELYYKLIPFDTTATGIEWEIVGQKNIDIDLSKNTIYGIKQGETYLRCVSTSTLSVASKLIHIIVE